MKAYNPGTTPILENIGGRPCLLLGEEMTTRIFLIMSIICVGLSACGDSGGGSPASIQGIWRGTVAYDPTSCGPLELLPNNISGHNFRVEIFDAPSDQGLCPVAATDQEGRRYFLNEPSSCDLDKIDEFILGAELQEDVSLPRNPTGIVFRSVTADSADVSVAFQVDLRCFFRFIGTFTREKM